MATYASLTDAQKADIATADTYYRGVTSSLMKLMRDADTATWNAWVIANVDSVVATLDDTELIPNSTGLGGAKNLTALEWKGLQAILRSISSNAGPNIGLITKAVGVNAG